MLATAGRPPDTPGRWAIEMKWDGMRAVCHLTGGRVALYSGNRNNVTSLGVRGRERVRSRSCSSSVTRPQR
ncbi:hypothetical protein [Nocardia abscessus]|uniref:ATP-dependent DNA ligase n=1 Tax=Nocardia abscessus TaxID=120957 RepID=UPI00313E198C